MLLIFDASQGYPARCIGKHPDDGDPVVITGLAGAVGADDAVPGVCWRSAAGADLPALKQAA